MARVLLVDDDRDLLEVARPAFEARGHEISCCDTLASALEAVRSGSFDAVIMDLSLPDGSGLAALRSMAETSRAPIIVMTGHADSELARDAELLGARRFLAKPVDIGALASRLGELIA